MDNKEYETHLSLVDGVYGEIYRVQLIYTSTWNIRMGFDYNHKSEAMWKVKELMAFYPDNLFLDYTS